MNIQYQERKRKILQGNKRMIQKEKKKGNQLKSSRKSAFAPSDSF